MPDHGASQSLSLFEIPATYQPLSSHRKGHWSAARTTISCDACTMDRHHHEVRLPIASAQWRFEQDGVVLHLCRPHALEMWNTK